MSDTHQLSKETAAAKQLVDEVKAHFGDDNEVDADLIETLIEGETDILEMCRDILKSAKEDERYAEAASSLANDYSERASRLKARSQSKRDSVAKAFQMLELKKHSWPEFTVSLREKPRQAIILDEKKIPFHLFKPQPKKLDKAELTKLLREGANIPGATLDNGGVSLTVRTK